MCQWVFYTYMRPRSDKIVIYSYETDEDEEQLSLIENSSDGGLRNTYTFPSDKAEETHKRRYDTEPNIYWELCGSISVFIFLLKLTHRNILNVALLLFPLFL